MRHRSPFGKRVGEKKLNMNRFLNPEPVKLHSPPIGWRTWKLSEDGKLQSVTSGTIWEGPVMTTALLKNGRPVKPMWENRPSARIEGVTDAGVYSYKHPKYLSLYLTGYPVYGRLEIPFGATGTEHELGWRTSKVVIQELFLQFNSPTYEREVADKLESLYSCEVKTGNFYEWLLQQEKEWVVR